MLETSDEINFKALSEIIHPPLKKKDLFWKRSA